MSPFNVLDTMLTSLSNFPAASAGSDVEEFVTNFILSNAQTPLRLLQVSFV